MNSRHRNAVKEWPLICIPLTEGLNGPMLAIHKSARRSKIEIVWRNRFPVRLERSSGPPVLVIRNARATTPTWLQSLIRFCGLSSICKGLLQGKPASLRSA
jgi:hypothetical protein